jgi:hypothetical protein
MLTTPEREQLRRKDLENRLNNFYCIHNPSRVEKVRLSEETPSLRSAWWLRWCALCVAGSTELQAAAAAAAVLRPRLSLRSRLPAAAAVVVDAAVGVVATHLGMQRPRLQVSSLTSHYKFSEKELNDALRNTYHCDLTSNLTPSPAPANSTTNTAATTTSTSATTAPTTAASSGLSGANGVNGSNGAGKEAVKTKAAGLSPDTVSDSASSVSTDHDMKRVRSA